MSDLSVVESRPLPQFDPTPEEARVLADIRARESSGDYSARNPAPGSTAAGAYQFIGPTWQLASGATGAPAYPSAAGAPSAVQDANALYMLRKYGPNASITWAASGPYNKPPAAPPPQQPSPLSVVESRPLAAAEDLSPLEKAGKAFVEGLGIPGILDIIRGSNRYGTPEEVQARSDRATKALGGIAQGIAAEPGRVWGELSRTGESMLKGDIPGTAYHLAGAVPMLGAPAQQVAADIQRGDPAAAVGHTGAMVAPFLADPAADLAGRGVAATGRAMDAAGTAVRGAVRGAAAAVPAAAEAGIEKSFYGALGGPAGMVGAAKIAAAKELGKGAITGAKVALAERAAQAAAAPVEYPAGGMATLSPDYFDTTKAAPVTAPTDEALVHLYSVETDPVKRSALRAQLVDRGVMQPEPGPVTPEANPYRGYSQGALQRVYELEQDPAKRVAIEQAARDRNLTLLNREGRRATAAVPETGGPEFRGPSITQDDALLLRYLGETDPSSASAETVAIARQLAAEKPELLDRLRAGNTEPLVTPPTAADQVAPPAAAATLEYNAPGVTPPVPAETAAPAAPAAPAVERTPGQEYAAAEGYDWAKLSAKDRRKLEQVAQARANAAAAELELATRPAPAPVQPPAAPAAPAAAQAQPLADIMRQPTPGQAYAASQGYDWSKLSAEDQAALEHVAQAQANMAGQQLPVEPQPAAAAAPQSLSDIMRGAPETDLEKQLRDSLEAAQKGEQAAPAAAPPAEAASAKATEKPNVFVKNARLAKAVRVADAAQAAGMKSTDVFKMSPDEFAAKVGEKSISADTMAMVVDKLRRRESDAARGGAPPAAPAPAGPSPATPQAPRQSRPVSK